VQVLQGIDLIRKNPQILGTHRYNCLLLEKAGEVLAARNFSIPDHLRWRSRLSLKLPWKSAILSTLTLSMGNDTFHKIQESIQLLRKEILANVQADHRPIVFIR
jgi:hypothetical protein